MAIQPVRSVWCVLVGLVYGTSAQAFQGRVILEDGSPAAGASVSVVGHSGWARTDAQGLFTWEPDPSLPFELLVVLAGGQYTRPEPVRELPRGRPLELRVQPVVAASVTVESGTAPNIEAPPASGTSTLPSGQIEERNPARLVDVLEDVPGAGRLSDLHAGVPSLRGLARGRTLILIDGARVTTERRAGPSATYLDPLSLEAVEVSRGPGSVAYGSDALGGVIHARTRSPSPGLPLSLRVAATLGAGLPECAGYAEVTRGDSKGGLLVKFRYRDFDAYQSPRGEVFNSEARDLGLLGRFSRELGPGLLELGWRSDLGRDIGRPTTRSRVTRVTYPREDSHRFTADYEVDPGGGWDRVSLHGFVGSYRLVTDREQLPSEERVRSLLRSDVSAGDFAARVLGVRPLGRARLETGLDLNGRFGLEALNSAVLYAGDAVESAQEVAIEDARRLDLAGYVNAQTRLDSRLTAAAGLRFDQVWTRNRGGFFGDSSTSNGAVSGYASLKLDLLPGLSLTGQLARGFRDPSLSDRYFRGVSGRGLVTGNPRLEPETSLQFDLAVRFTRGAWRLNAYAYRYRIDDLIERFEEGEDLFFFRNRGRAILRGLELEARTELGRGLTLELAAQAARGWTEDDDAPLDDVPAESLSLRLGQSLFEDRGYVRLRTALYARDEDPGPTERVTPGYARVDLTGGWRPSSHLELRLVLRNLLDKAYPVSPDSSAVLAPGFSASVTLMASF